MIKRSGWFLAGGLLVALLLTAVASGFASSSPDGLDATVRKGCTTDGEGTITGGTCVAARERAHEMKDGPLANYAVKGMGDSNLSTGLAGALGVLITFGVGGGLFWLIRRRG